MASTVALESYRDRLHRFYTHYAPEKVANIDKILTAYAGKEDTLMAELTKRYGPEPAHTAAGVQPAATTASTSPETEARIRRFYDKYAPEKAAEIPKILQAFAGKEDKLFASLVTKYGPEPPLPIRERLQRFYAAYAPEKISNIDKIVTHYAGREESLIEELIKRYGPEPPLTMGTSSNEATSTTASLPPSKHAVRIQRMLQTYTPEQIPQLDEMLKRYAGKEEQLLQALVKKFGPEPSGPEPSLTVGTSSKEATGTNVSLPSSGHAVRLQRMLQKYAPEKIPQLDEMLKRYAGKEEELLQALVKKFGPEPAAVDAESLPSAASDSNAAVESEFSGRVRRFLLHYAPEKASQIDEMLRKNTGKEEELLRALIKKFGPEPAAVAPTSATHVESQTSPAVLAPAWPSTLQSVVTDFLGTKRMQELSSRVKDPTTGEEYAGQTCSLGFLEAVFDQSQLWEAALQSSSFGLADGGSTTVRDWLLQRIHHEGGIASSAGDDMTQRAVVHVLCATFKLPTALLTTPHIPSYATQGARYVLETLVRSMHLSSLQRGDEPAARRAVEDDEALSITSQVEWRDTDRRKVGQLVQQRRERIRLVLSTALARIGDVEMSFRAELWRVQEIEAAGRFQWFQERRREILMFAKPPALALLEKKVSQWKALMSEQREAMIDTEWDRRARGSDLARKGAARSSDRGAHMDISAIHRFADPLMMQSALSPAGFPGTVGASPIRGGPLSPLRSPPSAVTHSSRRITPTRGGMVSPSVNTAAASPRSQLRATTPQQTKRWNQPTPKRLLAEQPSKVTVSLVSPTSLPPKVRIPTTEQRPFRLSTR